MKRINFWRNYLFTLTLLNVFVLFGCNSTKIPKSQRDEINAVINTAKAFTGTPYKWGGTTRAGMDCSGLLLNAFRAIGYDMPRTAREQSLVGRPVSKKKLRPGDIVFFDTKKGRKDITHAGIVTKVKDGDVYFIHASSSLGVVESNMSVKYYQKRFVRARRIF